MAADPILCGCREPCVSCLHAAGRHEDCDPDSCFTAKVRYWRDHGVSVVVPRDFH